MSSVIDRASVLDCWHGRPMRMPRAHRHDDIELNWCTSGRLVYLFGGDQFVVETETLAAFWAAAPHQLIDVADDARVYWLTIPLPTLLRWELPERFVRDLLAQRPLLWESHPATPPFGQWERDLATDSPYVHATAVLEIRALLRRLALRTGPATPRPGANAEDGLATSHVARMARFIADHFTQPVRVADIAAAAHLNRQYAMAVFRRVIGVTMTAYLNRCRVAEAQRLLIATELPAADIGGLAGFGSPSQFYSVFRAHCGCAPARYRRNVRGNP